MTIYDAQGTDFLSAVDGVSRSVTCQSKAHHSVKQRSHVHALYRFRLGRKSVSSYGFLVATNAEAAVQAPINNMLTKRYGLPPAPQKLCPPDQVVQSHDQKIQACTFSMSTCHPNVPYEVPDRRVHRAENALTSLLSFLELQMSWQADKSRDCRSVPMAVVRVIVSGRGVRLGSDYIFPEMTPVAIAYLWQSTCLSRCDQCMHISRLLCMSSVRCYCSTTKLHDGLMLHRAT